MCCEVRSLRLTVLFAVQLSAQSWSPETAVSNNLSVTGGI
jgi:hypothetical protein